MTRLLPLLLAACSVRQPDAANVWNEAVELCEQYQFATPEQRTENQDIACRNVRRVCVDGPIYPELQAPAPGYRHKIVKTK